MPVLPRPFIVAISFGRNSCSLQADNNAHGIIPTFEAYLELRRAASGVSICLDWAEAVGNFELPSHIHSHRLVQSLRQNTEDVVSMTNDLFSMLGEWNAATLTTL